MSTLIVIGFVWLLLHNQSQTEYLIFYDFWRNYNVLAGNGTFYQYLFHDVHTYAITSLFWYLDVWLARGSLKFFHICVLAATFAAFACLAFLSPRFFRAAAIHGSYAIAVATAAMALWLSPTNSFAFTYPTLHIAASALLLSLLLSAIIVSSTANAGMSGATRRVRFFGYLCVAVVGFFTSEIFLAAPLFLSLDAVLRRKYREALVHLLIAGFLLGLYIWLHKLPVPSASAGASHRDYLAFAHNFFMFLSMHFLVLLGALKIDPGTSANLAILASAIQLVALALFAASHYSGDSRADLSPRFALLLAVIGIVSIVLATWLRFSTHIMIGPIHRYTPISILFSMGVLFLASRALASTNGRALRLASLLAFLAISSYLLADAWGFWLRSYNPAARLAQSRMEMAVYATSPGSEIALGPQEPDDGRAY